MALLYDVAFNSQTRALSFSDRAGNNIYSCDIPSKPLTLTALADNSSVKLTKSGTLNNTFEVNTGSGWSAYTFGDVINLNEGDQCQWRCSSHPDTQSESKFVRFVMTGSIAASGNCNSMLDGTNFRTMTSLEGYNYAFNTLFWGCASLTRAPALPATMLANGCYRAMFYGTSLTQAPALPAISVPGYGYYNMFAHCRSIEYAPNLPATSVGDSAYYGMFDGCTSLVNAPTLPATTLANSCYATMFIGCTSLVNAPELPATTLAKTCYRMMFSGCTSLVRAPEMSFTNIPDHVSNTTIGVCYRMFYGCTSLTQVPDFPNATLESCCFANMFEGCTALANPPALPSTTASGLCYLEMFKGCTSLVRTPQLPATTLDQKCYMNMFNGCTALTQASNLPATIVPIEGYRGMFDGCTSLVNAPAIAATTCTTIGDNDGNNLRAMFANCRSLANPPEIHITTLAKQSLIYMFQNTAITKAPLLPATTLAEGCYKYIFAGTTPIEEVRIAATTTATDALTEWLGSTRRAEHGTVYADPSFTDLPADSRSGVPVGWVRANINDYPTTEPVPTTMYLYGEPTSVDKIEANGLNGFPEDMYLVDGVFQTLDDIHTLGYTLQEPVPTMLYNNGGAIEVGKIEAGGLDGFTEDMYFVEVGFMDLEHTHSWGYTLGAQTPITMYDENGDPVSAYSCDANPDDGFTETMYDVGDGFGYQDIATQNENGYTLNP
jgi:hypothetical protein